MTSPGSKFSLEDKHFDIVNINAVNSIDSVTKNLLEQEAGERTKVAPKHRTQSSDSTINMDDSADDPNSNTKKTEDPQDGEIVVIDNNDYNRKCITKREPGQS